MERIEAVAIRHPLRVQLLDALLDGKRLELATYAKALDLSLPRVTYHGEALAEAGAVELQDGVASITESGKELYRTAQRVGQTGIPDGR